MAGFGFGFRSGRRRMRAPAKPDAVRNITPGPQWNGQPGSGFVQPPVDPVRTTAKPAMRLITPANQYFTENLLVGVVAGANNAGSLLDNLGLEKVIVHYEGSRVDIVTPTYQKIIDANGAERSYLGWWINLRRSMDGHAQVYFEAVPKNPAIQRRVIGPWQFSPQSTLHDRSVTVAPSLPVIAGARYQSIGAAFAYFAQTSAQNPLITVTEPGTYDLGTISSTYQGMGYCTIKADVPVTIGKTGYTNDTAAMFRPRWDGIRFCGGNITIDARFVSNIYQENASGRQHWLDGIKVINSGGRYSLWRNGTRPIGYFVRNRAWFTECNLATVANVCVNAELVRGCQLAGGYSDCFTDAACVVHSSVDDWDSSDGWTVDVPALTVFYNGAEATATLAVADGNDSSSRKITATWGANNASLTVGNTEAMMQAGTYLVSHVAAWLTGLGVGFTASVLDDTRRAAALSLTGQKGAAFTARDVKTSPLTLVTMFDQHGDWYQQNTTGMIENCILANNTATNLVTQNVFVTGVNGAKDFLVFNNAFDNKMLSGPYNNNSQLQSQLARSQSHVVIAHNTWATQSLWLRGDQAYAPDNYCLIANNALRDILWAGSGSVPQCLFDNHLQEGATGSAIGQRTTVGGSTGQIYAGNTTGNFTARGPLANNLKVPVIAFDRKGMRRGTNDAAGSEAFAVPVVTEPPIAGSGCVQFPPFNRQFAGIEASIVYPNTGLLQTPLLGNGTPSAFFVMLQIPHERSKQNRESRVFGNAVATTASTCSLVHHGDNYFDGTRHDEFRWRSRGSAGDTLDLSVDVQLRTSRWQLIVVRSDGAGNYTIASYSPGLAKIAGTAQTTTLHSLNTLTGTHIALGDAVNAAGSLATYTAPTGAFDGAVAFHGFVMGDAGDDAKWQAICEGANVAQTLTSATAFRLFRDFRNGGATTAALSSSLPGDGTGAGIVQGTLYPGGSVARVSTTKYLHFDRLPDGYVVCSSDGADKGSVAVTGFSSGLTGGLFARVVSAEGAIKVPSFLVDGVAATMSVTVNLPRFQGWGYLEFWAESDPSLVHRMNSRIGSGDKLSVIGQSQADIMLYAGGITLAPTGLSSFCGYITGAADPADTTSSPVSRFSTAARAQLFVIPPQMTRAYNGVTAIAERIAEYNQGSAISVIDTAIPGTSARDWINDATTARQWALDVEVAALGGRDRVPIWQWYTAETGFDYRLIFDAVVFGTGPYVGNHTLYDGSLQLPGYKLGVCLPSRATSTVAGPLDADDFGFNRSYAQEGQIAWCVANPDRGVAGPAVTDMAIDNLATGSTSGPNVNLGGPHESQVAREGVYRLGYRIGETYLRVRGLSPCPGNPYVDPTQITINGARTEMLVKCVLPNQGTGLRTADGRPVAGFELSTNGGTTWSRSGFTATIVSRDTVRITNTVGAWPTNLRLTYLRGGPFSYGTAEELNAHYKGSLYDGSSAEGGLGVPVLGIATTNGVII